MQIFIDIALFLIYCGLTTLLLAWAWKFWMLYINNKFVDNLKWVVLEIKLPREINKSPEAAEIFLKSIPDSGGLGGWYKENWLGNMPSYSSLEIVSLEGVIHFYIRTEKKFRSKIEASIYAQYPNVEIVEVDDYVKKIPYKYVRNAKENPMFFAVDWKLAKSLKDIDRGIKGDRSKKEVDKLDKIDYSGDMYPIKTYKDWGLDKNPEEMYKHDPLTHVVETLGSIGKGEYMGYQILIRDAGKWNDIYNIIPNKDEKKKELGKTISDLAKIELERFKIKWSLKESGKSIGDDDTGAPKVMKVDSGKKDAEGKPIMEEVEIKYSRNIAESKPIPVGEREEDAKKNLELIQRKMSKQQVIAYVRTMYIADKMGDGRIPMIFGLFKGFSEDGYNNFYPFYVPDNFEYPWQNTMKRLVPWRTEGLYGGYMGRAGLFGLTPGGMSDSTKKFLDLALFNAPNMVRKIYTVFHNILLHPFKPTINYSSGFILNVEELATLFHFPGEVAATPTLPRIDSTKSSSPSDLPI